MLIWLKKVEHYKLKKYNFFLKVYIKMEKKIDNIKIRKQKFHQHKRPISIKNVDNDNIVVSNKVAFGKKGFKYFIGYEDAKKLSLFVYFYQKWQHIEKTLMKLNMYLF